MTLIVNISKKPKLAVNLEVFPNPACVPITQTVSFSGIVENSSNQEVIWTLVSGGGSIDTEGLYTAPASPGMARIRGVTSVDTTVFRDVDIYIKATAAECCDPLISVYPRTVTLHPGDTLQFELYENGVGASPTGAAWETDLGTITSGGFYTAPSSVVNEISLATVTGSTTSGLCYDTCQVVVANNNIGIEVTPKFTTVRPNQVAVFTSEVIGSDNQNVVWSIQQYYEDTTYPVSYSPAGITTADVSGTAPSGVPSYPYIRFRATSVIGDGIWDEGIMYVVSGVLPLKHYHCTYYKANESCDPDVSEEDLYLETDAYKGNVTPATLYRKLETQYVGNYSYQSPLLEEVTKPAWPGGAYTDDFIWMTAYDSVTIPPTSSTTFVKYRPTDPSDTRGIAWNRTYKAPQWDKVFFTIDTTSTITNPSYEFIQHDFISLGSDIEVITGAIDYVPDTTASSVTFAYQTDYGFFSGLSGEAFDPVANARDIVRLTADLDGAPYDMILYFRPEPDLPEIFPEIVGPYYNDGFMYFPGESPVDFEVGNPLDYRGTKPIAHYDGVAQYMSSDMWIALHQHCSEECATPPEWCGQQVDADLPFQLPYTESRSQDASRYPLEHPSSAPGRNGRSWIYPIMMNYYHGRWACFLPAIASCSFAQSSDGTVTLTDVATYELKLTAYKNRHFMSYEPNLVGKAAYPATVNFSILAKNVSTGFGPTHTEKTTADIGSTFDSSEVLLSADTTNNAATFKSQLTSFTGKPRMAYIKVTPDIFEGTYTRSVLVPIHLFGVGLTGKVVSQEVSCETYYHLRYRGPHLVQDSGLLGDSAETTVVFYVWTPSMAKTDIGPQKIQDFPKINKYASGGQVPVEGLATISTQREELSTGYSTIEDNTWESYSSYKLAEADQGSYCEFTLTVYGPEVRNISTSSSNYSDDVTFQPPRRSP